MFKQIVKRQGSRKIGECKAIAYNKYNREYLILKQDTMLVLVNEELYQIDAQSINTNQEIKQIKWLSQNKYILQTQTQLLITQLKNMSMSINPSENQQKQTYTLQKIKQINIHHQMPHYLIQQNTQLQAINHSTFRYSRMSIDRHKKGVLDLFILNQQLQPQYSSSLSYTKLKKDNCHYHTLWDKGVVLTYKSVLNTDRKLVYEQYQIKNKGNDEEQYKQLSDISKKTIIYTFEQLKINPQQSTIIVPCYVGKYWLLHAYNQYWIICTDGNIVSSHHTFKSNNNTNIILKALNMQESGIFIISQDGNNVIITLHSNNPDDKFKKVNEFTIPDFNYKDIFIDEQHQILSIIGENQIQEFSIVGKSIIYTKILQELNIVENHHFDAIGQQLCSLFK